jgi:hypothetical protein
MPGIGSGLIRGRQLWTRSLAFVASRRVSKGSPESGGDRYGFGDDNGKGAQEVTCEVSSAASTLLPMKETHAARASGLLGSPADGPLP